MTSGLFRYAGCGLILLTFVVYGVSNRKTIASANPPLGKPSIASRNSDNATTLETYRKAAELEKNRKYAEAVAELRSVPGSEQDYLWNMRVGWLQFSSKEYRNAQNQFEAAIRLESGSFESRTALLLAMISQEKYTDVEKTARQVLQHDPDNYYANLRLSYVYRLQFKYQQAVRINQKMLILYPADANFLIEQALALTWQKKYDESRPIYHKVLLVSPDNTIANQALSIAQGTRARDFTSEAFRKAYNFELEGKYTDAIAALASVKSNKTHEYFLNLRLGWLNYLAGQQVESQSRYETAVKLSPRAVEPLTGLLLPLLTQEKYSEAERIAQQAVQLDSLNYYARLRLGYALRRQKKFAEAERSNDLILRHYPTDVSLLLEQALSLQGLQRESEAATLFRRVQLLAPENVTAGKALLNGAKSERAR